MGQLHSDSFRLTERVGFDSDTARFFKTEYALIATSRFFKDKESFGSNKSGLFKEDKKNFNSDISWFQGLSCVLLLNKGCRKSLLNEYIIRRISSCSTPFRSPFYSSILHLPINSIFIQPLDYPFVTLS